MAASFCVRPNGILQYDLCFYGRRFRGSSGLSDVPDNRCRVCKNVQRIKAEWKTATFDYAAWVPNSHKLAEAQRWLREHGSRLTDQRFAAYTAEWYRLHGLSGNRVETTKGVSGEPVSNRERSHSSLPC